VTGPFKINGVPLRRVNSRYVIATSTKVDIGGLDQKTVDKVSSPEYFAREKKSRKQKGEDAFLKQGEKPEVGLIYHTPFTFLEKKSRLTTACHFIFMGAN
jgi:ribosomal protein L14E/L6E/L27E